MDIEEIKDKIVAAARELSADEPIAQKVLCDLIFSQTTFAGMLAATLSRQVSGAIFNREELEALFLETFEKKPEILLASAKDLHATVLRDPACRNYLEPMIFFKGFQALQIHRVAHVLWEDGRTFAAKLLQSVVSRKLGLDIHPAAQVGHGILVDHGTNIVIGETATIGNNVSILHGVTLGGTGNETGDRHPKIASGVMIGAHAQLLGNIHIGEAAKIGAGAVVVCDVPAHTTFAGVPAVNVGHCNDAMPSFEMQQDFTRD